MACVAMAIGLVGRKVGMTQVFDEHGKAVPVTVIQAGPCVVVQRKTAKAEGMTSIRDVGMGKVLAGLTSLKELNKVTFVE